MVIEIVIDKHLFSAKSGFDNVIQDCLSVAMVVETGGLNLQIFWFKGNFGVCYTIRPRGFLAQIKTEFGVYEIAAMDQL